jgi:hypothetical protein
VKKNVHGGFPARLSSWLVTSFTTKLNIRSQLNSLTVNVHAKVDLDEVARLDGLRGVGLKGAVVAHHLVQ